ncbi:RcnB family protein [Chitinimonas sp. PSY-7]|uniref:RcnB family protein n=1 Tax=Chitinimonas sp. PSY-7 TaxID=3459088 RepID=UPI00403FC8DD
MKNHVSLIILSLVSALVVNGTVLADKPAWAGGNKHGKDKHAEKHHEDRDDTKVAFHFDDDERRIIGDYYGKQASRGKCPPGLAKKNNGCMPPGQAKKWSRGRPLPPDVRYYELPGDLLRRLPPPPPRHRYVQIAGDILLIAIGTSMVIDAVEDILR